MNSAILYKSVKYVRNYKLLVLFSMNIQQFKFTNLRLSRSLYLQDFEVASSIIKYCTNKRILDYYLIKYTRLGIILFVNLLLEHGANVQVNENICLIIACYNAQIELVELLINYGADVNVNNGKPLACITFNKDIHIAKLLLTNGADVNLNTFPLVWNGLFDVELMTLFLEYGLDLSKEYETVLRRVGINEHYHVKLFNFLIDHGFKFDKKLN